MLLETQIFSEKKDQVTQIQRDKRAYVSSKNLDNWMFTVKSDLSLPLPSSSSFYHPKPSDTSFILCPIFLALILQCSHRAADKFPLP